MDGTTPTEKSLQCIQEQICFHGIADSQVDSLGGHTSEVQAMPLEFLATFFYVLWPEQVDAAIGR